MRFEVVVLPAAEVARANDLDRVRQGVAAAVGAIGDLKRGARVAQSYGEHPLTAVRRPAFAMSPDLADFSGRVSHSGEGRWTVLAAVDTGVPASVIAASLYKRFESRDIRVFTAKVLSALRSEFGGHAEREA